MGVTPSAPAVRLSREEVAAKYGPKVDQNWTPEIEEAFFQSLPTTPPPVRMSPAKRHLLREFACATLGAKRVSEKYLDTLGSVLHSFAVADRAGGEVVLSQRSAQHGEPQTIRTIQGQMVDAGLLVKEVRSQGHGFVGSVFVYSPRRHSKATWDDLNAACRAAEQDGVSLWPLPANIRPGDVPY
ncbi:hypothetical protein CKO18_14925 [Rhodoferax fermentans]|uniref:Uncharacterized protein n=1 Tax=Rhodoferax fermentans TaxID=28066 RepID=A0A1T1AWF4_RHOFE|nr:hypothetical protein [Rhodoferax fermentans]OOV08452.1 hypothetical protein RF819_18685 [Rhodoferax fermentans]